MASNIDKTGISERFLTELLNYCLSDDRVEKVMLFGSRARGDFRNTSDIDLAIYTNDITHSEQNLIEYYIREVPTHLKIDIVFMDRLVKEGLIKNILRDGVILYEQGKAVRKAR